jgi:hypothetical protein
MGRFQFETHGWLSHDVSVVRTMRWTTTWLWTSSPGPSKICVYDMGLTTHRSDRQFQAFWCHLKLLRPLLQFVVFIDIDKRESTGMSDIHLVDHSSAPSWKLQHNLLDFVVTKFLRRLTFM